MDPVCATCGAVYPEAEKTPQECPICADERQWVPEDGQKWTSLEELANDHGNELRKEDAELIGIGIEPEFAIGQRMLLLESAAGNVLWDMIPLCTEDAVAEIHQRGGAAAIAISHPHYYSGMLEWSHALGDVPILLHAADREWVTRPDPLVEHWDGEIYELTGGLTLLHLGGHFAGGTVLHWPDGADGRGALLSGDIVQVLPHRRAVTFMWSYPNMLPLPAQEVRRMAETLDEWDFDRIWGAWWGRVIRSGAKDVIRESAERYARASASIQDP
jgi:glyoxylase-like metal-dependent hydrolase (beta-lactamase superfamily II)